MELLISVVVGVPVLFMVIIFVVLPLYHGARVLAGGVLMVAEEAGFIDSTPKIDMAEAKRARRKAGW